jgi:hypothetical protein
MENTRSYVEIQPAEKCSVYADSEREANCYKWIESEKAGRDLGEAALRRWVQQHWWGYLRARWVEHLQGTRFWVELDRGDFGLLRARFQDKPLLLDRILDRLKTGQENLDIILWALDWGISVKDVRDVLQALDINSKRLAHRFDPLPCRS